MFQEADSHKMRTSYTPAYPAKYEQLFDHTRDVKRGSVGEGEK